MNTLYYPSGAGPITVKPCRAYFQLNGMQMADNSSSTGGDEEFIPSSGGDVKAFVMDIESDATSVETLLEKSKSDRCYTLDGRHIDGNRLKVNGSELKSGIYIVNGRKVLVK